MLGALAEFAEKLEGAKVGLFFYAGHGLQLAGENYLVPVDARLSREAQVRLQAVPVRTVLELMEAEVPTRLVLLDACRDNPLARTLARSMGATRSAAVGQGLAQVQAGVGTLIAYSTAPGAVALDGTGEHSPFTAALLEHIATPGLEVRQVLGRVRGAVLDATDDKQVPWDSSSLRGELYLRAPEPVAALVPSPAPEPMPVPPPGIVADYGGRDRAAFDAIRDSARARDFAMFLQRFPKSALAFLAESRLEELEERTTTAALPLPPAAPPAPPVVLAPSPAEIEAALGLGRENWRRLQEVLTVLGFDTRGTDGRPGQNTRKAIAAWQASKGQGATGYLAGPQRDLIMDEARPRLAALSLVPEAPPALGRRDEPAEVAQLRQAAEQGDAAAQVALGFRYERGQGVTRDEAEAVRWYRMAAEQGYATAQYNLGRMYANGRGGLAKDDAEAVRWFRKAAEQGNADAAAALSRLGRAE
jgi:peptidoglycan hydrolase-like protein with peptidoglycan-binding domain